MVGQGLAMTMTYIVRRQDRFYVVARDGLDSLAGREQRRWHPVGHDRDEANALAARLDRKRTSSHPRSAVRSLSASSYASRGTAEAPQGAGRGLPLQAVETAPG